MKFLRIAFISTFFLFSCKKECLKNNILKGKLKTLTEYGTDSVNALYRFYYFYDSVSGELKSVNTEVKLSGVYFQTGSYNLLKENINTIYFSDRTYNNDIVFKVKLNGKQIVEIIKVDTVNQLETLVTIPIYINNTIDSIFDIGGSNLYSDIKYFKFNYTLDNCSFFSCSWTENNLGTINYKNATYKFSYTEIINPYNLRYQIPGALFGGGDNANNMNIIISLLGIDGYHLVKQNKNLIDSMDVNGIKTKYNYTIKHGKITSVNYIESSPQLGSHINDMTYYE